MSANFSFKILLLALLVLLLPFPSATAQSQPSDAVDLRVMTFNIWVGGELVDFSQVVAAIQAADADIVGLQETGGNTRRLADALGWPYANQRLQIISRFPLIDPPGADGAYIFAQIKPGAVVAVSNIHLTSDPYGPYAVRDGATLEEVLALEAETRLPEIEARLAQLAALLETDTPLFLTGDFNTPSHRDWTDAVVATNAQRKYAVAWPVTQAVERVGFIDTYRTAHPDPVARPGNTWTYGYPHPRLKPDEMIDRIDQVFAANVIKIIDSEVVGEAGGPDVAIGVLPFPSDHRGVVSTMRVMPVEPPHFVAVDRPRVERGDPFVVRYHAPGGEEEDRIVIVPAGGDATEDALMWLPPYEASFFGSVTFGSAGLEAGTYEAVLVDGDAQEVARNGFWVVDPDARPTVAVTQASYKQGETIGVAWQNAPGNRADWVGVYAVGDPDLYNGYWGYIYTEGAVSGEALFDETVLGEAMLPPGDYEARLFLDDGYAVLATTSFTVSE